MMPINILQTKINNELSLIYNIVKDVKKTIDEISNNSTPREVEKAGIASFLHSFYNGIERIMIFIAKHIDREVPEGFSWHRELLLQMGLAIKDVRPEVFSQDSIEILEDYLSFRHRFRHAYASELRWNKIRDKALRLENDFKIIQDELIKFNYFLENLKMNIK